MLLFCKDSLQNTMSFKRKNSNEHLFQDFYNQKIFSLFVINFFFLNAYTRTIRTGPKI